MEMIAQAFKTCADELPPISQARKTCVAHVAHVARVYSAYLLLPYYTGHKLAHLSPIAQALKTCADELSPIAQALKT